MTKFNNVRDQGPHWNLFESERLLLVLGSLQRKLHAKIYKFLITFALPNVTKYVSTIFYQPSCIWLLLYSFYETFCLSNAWLETLLFKWQENSHRTPDWHRQLINLCLSISQRPSVDRTSSPTLLLQSFLRNVSISRKDSSTLSTRNFPETAQIIICRLELLVRWLVQTVVTQTYESERWVQWTVLTKTALDRKN